MEIKRETYYEQEGQKGLYEKATISSETENKY